MSHDDRAAGDPRDPRHDLDRGRRARRRPLLPRWAWVMGGALLAVAVFGLRDVIATAPGAVARALLFGVVLVVGVGGLLLWADRRWPQRGPDDD